MDWEDRIRFAKWLFVVLICMTLFVFISSALYEYIEKLSNRPSVEAVNDYEKKGGVCYVDGVKQDDTFDVDGVDLDNYTATYKNGKLYLKSKVKQKDFHGVTPVVVPILH